MRRVWLGAVAAWLLSGCGADVDPLQVPGANARAATLAPIVQAPVKPAPRVIATKPKAVAAKPAASAAKPAAAAGEKPAAAAKTAAPADTPALPDLPILGQGRDFQLTDQFDKPHTFRFPKDRPSVLAFGDKDGSGQIEGWITPLAADYLGRIDIEGVAELGMVPGFARGMVKGIMSALTKNPVMLDWTGSVSKAYGYTGGGQAAIYVLDANGGIRWQAAGAVSGTGLTAAKKALDQLLTGS
jgi:hypothetical protein